MGSFFGGKPGQSESKPWAPAIPHLDKILNEMGGWYDSAKNEGYISQTGDLDSIYGNYLNQLQQMGQGAVDKGQGLLNQGLESLQGTQAFYDKMMNGGGDITSADITNMANDFINNDLLQGQIDAANRDTARDLMENTLPGIDRAAVDSGNMGSSRTGVAAAVAERGANEKMADTSASMRGQAYNNALNQAQSVLTGNLANQYGAAQGAGNTANNLMNTGSNWGNMMMGSMSPLLQQSQLQAMLQGANQADKIGNRDYLANLLGQYSNIASGIGGLGGNSIQNNPGTSTFDKLIQLGMVGGSFFGKSDPRLKKNIKKTGQVGDINTYTWDWNEVAEEVFGLTGSDRGVMADEVMKLYPECVTTEKGYMKVHYSKLEELVGGKLR